MDQSNPFDLTGRVALITGANSHGIGNQAARVLAAYGAKVFLTDIRADGLQDAVASIEAAGGCAAGCVSDVSKEEDCQAAVAACVLDGIFYMVKYGWEECAKNGVGSIIPVASLAAWKAAGSVAYTATKGAIRSMTPCLAKLLAPHGVRVNTLYPGFIDTDMTHAATEFEPFVKSKLQAIPMGRFGTVDDCAYGVLYLASDASSFMCGQHLVIDGGELA